MFCAVLFILFFGVSASEAVKLRVFQDSYDNYVSTSVDNITGILPYLNTSRTTLFYTFGINSDPDSDSVQSVVSNFLDTDYNVVLLDWSKEARNLLINEVLSYVLYNTISAEAIGCNFGKKLVTLIENGLNVSDFFLMGHSLGAQLMGTAGRCANKTGYPLSKIVGLDPAGPEFTSVLDLLPTLDTTCADKVIIIHTDPKALGSSIAAGHIDFFPNYNSTYTNQPGCTGYTTSVLTNNCTTWNHGFSWKLISASVNNSNLLEAVYATDGDAWEAGQGNTSDITYISVNPTSGANGSYFLRTSGDYPYGLGENGIYPS